jgi:hypothetical protein
VDWTLIVAPLRSMVALDGDLRGFELEFERGLDGDGLRDRVQGDRHGSTGTGDFDLDGIDADGLLGA